MAFSRFVDVTLTPELEAFVQRKVDTGRYAHPIDVIREALQTLDRKEEFESSGLEEILEEAVNGPHEPLTEETFERIRRAALAKE